MTTCAVIVGTFVVRSRNERQLNAYFAGACAKLTIEPSGPVWLRRLIGDRFFEHVVGIEWFEFGLPALRNGQDEFNAIALSGDDVARLCRLPKLRTLDLGGLCLTDETLSRLDGLLALDKLALGDFATCSVAAVERLADHHPDWDIDLAFAEHLYQLTAEEYRSGTLSLCNAIMSMQIAERWKLACAEFKDVTRAQTAAREQYIRWLVQIQERVEELAKTKAPGVSGDELDLIHCAVAKARLDLARARHDDAAVAAIDGSPEAGRLVASFDAAIEDGSVDLYAMTLGWPIAADVLLKADAVGSENARAVLRRQVEAFRRLAKWLKPLHAAGDRRGTAEAMRLARVALASAEARLYEAEDDAMRARRALERAETDAQELRMAVLACFEMGVMRLDEFLFACEIADTFEFELSRIRRDRHAEQAIAEASADLLARKVFGMKYMCRMGPNAGASRSDKVLQTASAIVQLRAGGADSLALPAARLSFWRQVQEFAREAANTNDDELFHMDPANEDRLSHLDSGGQVPDDFEFGPLPDVEDGDDKLNTRTAPNCLKPHRRP